MSNARFISLIRQYARLAAAKKTSYADSVRAVIDLRNAEILRESKSDDAAARAQDKAMSIAVREYGTVDAKFAVESDG